MIGRDGQYGVNQGNIHMEAVVCDEVEIWVSD